MKRVLMVAYHFPPLAGSSGIQRTLRFVQHLPSFGWQPIVLTAHPRAYERTSDDLMAQVPAGVHVERAFALDAARHLSIGGRYLDFSARPDRWISWRYSAVPAGMRLIARFRPDVLWSTYPIATAHVIGESLCRRSQLPWIADFRDPMAQEGYPEDAKTWQSFKRIEERALHRARYSVFTTPSAARGYAERYPDAAGRIELIENGFDEESFANLAGTANARRPLNPGAITLLHSGVVYPSERDPTQFFAAVRSLVDQGRLNATTLRIRFRASGHDAHISALVQSCRLEACVELLPPVPYHEALDEMLRADGLLLLQAANCNEQIPAKFYEYLRAGRPIVALTDPRGDTAAALREAGVQAVARLESSDEIADLLETFVGGGAAQRFEADKAMVAGASRKSRAAALAKLLDVASGPP